MRTLVFFCIASPRWRSVLYFCQRRRKSVHPLAFEMAVGQVIDSLQNPCTVPAGLTPLSSVGSTPLSGSPRKGSAGQKLTPLPYNRNSDLFLQSAGSSFRRYTVRMGQCSRLNLADL